jgi:hypothetical protein
MEDLSQPMLRAPVPDGFDVGSVKETALLLGRALPTSTAHQSRLQIFQPTRRPVWQERRIETPWGRATIRGRIGQAHADVLESLCRYAEASRVVLDTGHLMLLIDPYKIRVIVGAGEAYSKTTLWRLLAELRKVSIMLDIPSRKIKMLGGILSSVVESPATPPNRLTPAQDRSMWRVTLEPSFALLLKEDLPLHYDPVPLAKLESGIAQAVARHVLTHRESPEGGWLVDTLIHAVGAGGVNNAELRKRRMELKASRDLLAEMGIVVEDRRVTKIL